MIGFRLLLGRRSRLSITFAVLMVSVATTSCARSRVMCDYAPFDRTIVGELVARHGATATFTVTSVIPAPPSPASRRRAPAIVKGRRVAVHYPVDQIRFLHVGRSYHVDLWWFSNRFESGVHVSDDTCSTGTENADGSAINTSAWSRARKGLVIGVAVVVLVFLSVTAAAFLRSRRRSRR